MTRYLPVVCAVLVTAGSWAACTRQDGAIFEAIARGDAPAVERLVAAGGDLQQRDAQGATPLIRAVLEGREEVVAALVPGDRGIDSVVELDASALPARLHVEGYVRVRLTPLMLASLLGHESIVRRLLDGGAAPAVAGEKGMTPLHVAALAGQTSVVRLLLEHGAATDVRTRDGALASDLALAGDHTETAAVLDEARRRSPRRWVDVRGMRPLGPPPASASWRESSAWGTSPVGIAVDADGRVYWAQHRTNTLHRADGDGRNPQPLGVVHGPRGLAYDHPNERLWFVTDSDFPRSLGYVDINKGEVRVVWEILTHRPFAVAAAADGVYWTESVNGRVRRAELDGSNITTLYSDGISSLEERPGAVPMSSDGIVVDAERRLVFWTDALGGRILRMRLPDGQPQTILDRDDGLVLPTALALDRSSARLYWTDIGSESIHRASYRGLQVERLADTKDGVLEPYGLAVDPPRRLLYWTDLATDEIRRRSLDGGATELFLDLAADPLEPPAAAPCDARGRTMRRLFFDRWLKAIRTCALQSAARKAVQRHASDVRPAARVCAAELARVPDRPTVLRRIAEACPDAPPAQLLEASERLGALILGTDYPKAGDWLRGVRPFLVAASSSGAADASLAWLDTLARHLDELEIEPEARHAWTLPATGQKTTFRATLARDPDSGPQVVPDDGRLRTGTPARFVDNHDGTITDVATGRMWEKKCAGCGGLHDVDDRLPRDGAGRGSDVETWLADVNREGGAGFAGYADWRLPSASELLGLVDYERFNPATGPAFDGALCAIDCDDLRDPNCSCTRFQRYWSGTTAADEPNLGVTVSFHLGLVQRLGVGEPAQVRAVRGPREVPQANRFVDRNDGTILDTRTGLMWEKKCNCPGDPHDSGLRLAWTFEGPHETVWDWLASLNGAEGGGFAGHDDWRIPNLHELASLLDLEVGDVELDAKLTQGSCQGLDAVACAERVGVVFWTSTTFADFPAHAYGVDFSDATIGDHLKTTLQAVRAVRGPSVPNSSAP